MEIWTQVLYLVQSCPLQEKNLFKLRYQVQDVGTYIDESFWNLRLEAQGKSVSCGIQTKNQKGLFRTLNLCCNFRQRKSTGVLTAVRQNHEHR